MNVQITARVAVGIACCFALACSDPAIDTSADALVGSSNATDMGAAPDSATSLNPDSTVSSMDMATSANRDEVDDFIRSLGTLSAAEPSKIEMDPSEPMDEGDYRCTTRTVSETKRQEQMVAYQANSESLWVGALIRGSAIADGLLTQVVTDRAPIDFSLSLESLDGERSATMNMPSLSSYRDEKQRLLSAGVTGATPAYIFSEIQEIHSAEQLQIHLGIDVSGLSGEIASTFDFSSENTRSRYMVNFVQAYYTADLDPPTSPAGFFPPSVTREQLYEAFGGAEGGPPLYVASITYGRRVIFTAESSVSSTELKAALEFAYNGAAVDIGGDVSLTHQEVLESSSLTAFILGGSGEMASMAITSLEQLRSFIEAGGNYSPDSPGAPIAYKLAHLGDNSAARMSFTTEYDLKECERISQNILVRLQNLKYVDGNQRNAMTYGTIYVDSTDREGQTNRLTLFDKSPSERFELSKGEVWPAMGQIAEGVVRVNPEAGQVITLGVRMREYDGLGSNDQANAVAEIPFEAGWRHDCDSARSGGYVVNAVGPRVEYDIRFCLQPVQ